MEKKTNKMAPKNSENYFRIENNCWYSLNYYIWFE